MADVLSLVEEDVAHNLQKYYSVYSTAEQEVRTKLSQDLANRMGSIWQEPTLYQADSKKRKATNNGNFGEASKRLKSSTSLPKNLSKPEIQMESHTMIAIKPETISDSTVDEDEWAAFEADIAEAERPESITNIVISAPALTAEEIKRKSIEEEYTFKREKEDANILGDMEDAAQKMEEELQKMEMLEERVKRLRAKREELRKKKSTVNLSEQPSPKVSISPPYKDISDDDDENYDDDDEVWDNFRLRE